MEARSDDERSRRELRRQVLGFGDFSAQKSYFPVLSQQVDELQALREALDAVSDGIAWVEAATGRAREANRAARLLLGLDLVGRADAPLPPVLASAIARSAGGEGRDAAREPCRFSCIGRDGVERSLSAAIGGPSPADPGVVVIVVRDITAERAAQRALAESEARYRLLFEAESDAIVMVDVETRRPIDANQAAVDLYGYAREELLALTASDLSVEPEDAAPDVGQGESVLRIPLRYHRKKDGTVFPVEIAARLLELDGRRCLLAAMRDITERVHAEEEREHLEAQLGQAQKLESVGRLAGGVAHDFNNMLQVILGHVHLAMSELSERDPLFQHLGEIGSAAQRSADLTKQLLAFARRQSASPTRVDMNASIAATRRMLKRLVGEEIEFAWSPGDALWPVRIDASQLDQVVTNLVVNARDAIGRNGRITVATRNVPLTAGRARLHPGTAPGDYVELAVADTGVGMTPEVQAQVFEPFFTTKGAGEGTGLGLAMVYGIVRQNRGFIEIESAPGEGTCFRVCFPRDEEADAPRTAREARTPTGGSETVLLVEDEDAILALGRVVLERQGYTVLAADNPTDALRLAEGHRGEIHLLLTDVVMPGMGGKELAELLVTLRPGIRCLFMSGYPDDRIGHQGLLDPGIHFIHKPFSVSELSSAVRAVLDGPQEQR